MKFDIITVGSAVVDAFLDTGINEKNKEICVPAGVKIHLKDLWFSPGGDGVNTAVAFSKLGFKTGFFGKIGRDGNAQLLLNQIKKYKVEFLGKQADEPTGFSVIIDSRQKSRTILTYGGANNFLKTSEFPFQKVKTKWLYFSTGGRAMDVQAEIVQWAFKKNVKIAFNPSAHVKKEERHYLKEILKHTEVLILNDEEARSIVSEKDLFTELHKLGPEIVCITHGEKGSSVSDKKLVYSSKPRKIKVAERTGAGDAFSSGFIFGLAKFNDVRKALITGSLNAESVIQKPGAQNGLLSFKEMIFQLKNSKIEITQDSG